LNSCLLAEAAWQGDQIGRFYAQWLMACFGQRHENYRRTPYFGPFLFNGKIFALIYVDKKMGWATLWANF
jgi:hypothetical protein